LHYWFLVSRERRWKLFSAEPPKKAGGGKRAMIGGLVGGLLGGYFIIPNSIPIIGTIIGILLGSFIGASGFELLGGKEAGHSIRVGYGAAKGRFQGMLLKGAIGALMFLIILVAAFP